MWSILSNHVTFTCIKVTSAMMSHNSGNRRSSFLSEKDNIIPSGCQSNNFSNIKIIDVCIVTRNYHKTDLLNSFNILELNKGDIIHVIGKSDQNWLDVLHIKKINNCGVSNSASTDSLNDTIVSDISQYDKFTIERGWFPYNFVKPINDSKLRAQTIKWLVKVANLIIKEDPYGNHNKIKIMKKKSKSFDISGYNSIQTKRKSNEKQDNLEGKNDNYNFFDDHISLADYKYISVNELESSFYSGKFADLLAKNLPIFWNVKINNDLTNELIYYNRELKLFTLHLPVLINPNIRNLVTNFTDNNTHNRNSTTNTSYGIPRRSTTSAALNSANSTSSKPNSLVLMEATNTTPMKTGSLRSSTNPRNSTDGNNKSNESDSKKDTSNSRYEKNNTGSGDSSNKPFFADDKVFYNQKDDIKFLIDLFQNVLLFNAKAKQSFLQRDKLRTVEYLKSLSVAVIYINIVVRSLESFLVTSFKKEIRRLLKVLIRLIATSKITINIYFTNRKVIYKKLGRDFQSEFLRHTSVTKGKVVQGTEIKESCETNNMAIINPQKIGHKRDFRNGQFSTFTIQSDHNIGRKLDEFDVGEKLKKLSDEWEIEVSYISEFDSNVSKEFDRCSNILQLLFYCLQNGTVLPGNSRLLIPQAFPRFFQKTFNTGPWNNPFKDFREPHNDTSDDQVTLSMELTNFGTATTDPPLVPESKFIVNNGSLLFKRDDSNASINTKELPDSSESSYSRVLSNKKSVNTKVSSSINTKSKNKLWLCNKKYPLNQETLTILKTKWDESKNFVIKFLNDTEAGNFSNREMLKTYTEISERLLNNSIIDKLDLSFFSNLRDVVFNGDQSSETIKLFKHSIANISNNLDQLYVVKQAYHNNLIKMTMVTQMYTINDPRVFNSMKTSSGVGYYETCFAKKNAIDQLHSCKKNEDLSQSLFNILNQQDGENDLFEFLDVLSVFRSSFLNFLDTVANAHTTIEKLLENKQTIINFAARTMQDELIIQLQKDEIKNSDWIESELIKYDRNEESTLDLSKDMSEETKWFLQPIYNNEVIYDKTSKRIKFASKIALVESLIYGRGGKIDFNFSRCFLLTFRSMFKTTAEFILSLMTFYNANPPNGLNYDEFGEWVEKRATVIKLNIVKILDLFFRKYWTNSYYEEEAANNIRELLSIIEAENIKGAKALTNIWHKIYALCTKPMGILHTTVDNLKIGNEFKPKDENFKELKLSRIPVAQFAQQLTLLNHELFSKIEQFECLEKIWGKKQKNVFGGSSNIKTFIEHANNLTNYVSYRIVSQTDMKKRVKIITYFIAVAAHCAQLHNYASLTAIISALYSSPILRLKNTWGQVPQVSREVLERLDKLMDSKKNFINYRESLGAVPDHCPVVPFFGVCLSDLTFAEAGNQDRGELFNFRKRFIISNIIKEIEHFQQKVYTKIYVKNNDLQHYIITVLSNSTDLEQQYEASLTIEPKNKPTSEDTNGRNNSQRGAKFWKKKQPIKFFT